MVLDDRAKNENGNGFVTARTLSDPITGRIQQRTQLRVKERNGFFTVLRHQPTSHSSALQTSSPIFFCHFHNLPPQTQTQTPVQCFFSTPIYIFATLSPSQSHHRFQNLLSFHHSPPPFHPSSHAHCFRSSTPVSFFDAIANSATTLSCFFISLFLEFYYILFDGYFGFTSVSMN